jgi:thiol peroxidase
LLIDKKRRYYGLNYGVLIKELRLLARSVFIIDKENKIRYIEIVPELTNSINFESALNFIKRL